MAFHVAVVEALLVDADEEEFDFMIEKAVADFFSEIQIAMSIEDGFIVRVGGKKEVEGHDGIEEQIAEVDAKEFLRDLGIGRKWCSPGGHEVPLLLNASDTAREI
jgi:hypothetical protein